MPTDPVPTDAVPTDATAVLTTLRGRVQALHEAHDLVVDDDPVSGEGATALADAAVRLGALLTAAGEVLDPERTEEVRRGVAHLGELAEEVRAADAVADSVAGLLDDVPRALVAGPVADRARVDARERRAAAAAALVEAATSPSAPELLHLADRLVTTPPLTLPADRPAGRALAAAARADLEAFTSVADATDPVEDEDRGRPGPEEAHLPLLRRAATGLASSAALALGARDEAGKDGKAGKAGKAGKEKDNKARKRARHLVRAAEQAADAAREVADLAATRHRLVDLADLAHRRGDPGFTYGLAHAAASTAEGRARTRLVVALDDALDAARAKKLRSWLAD